ncbi:hypothetical protein [Idiomarina sp.]|uniref:hypothetical protein n=1 Tax=Idiomarina sp. TaxID=1874361 RepID=UPI000C582A35|nr:hypothetical protein [Idiomarina sp.]MAO66795.1 hypothetical protein [Idiomarina sp.]
MASLWNNARGNALAALLTTACASSKRVVVDKQGIDEAQYQQDLTDCRAVGAEVSTGRDDAKKAKGKT